MHNILDVYFSNLKFGFHPLFSIEHVFAEKLRSLYEQYVIYETENSLNYLRDNLLALRSKRDQTELDEEEEKDLIREIEIARELYFEKAHKYRELINSILNTWRQLKKIRQNQSFTNTNVKLLIKKEEMNMEQDTEINTKFFNETLEELLSNYKLKHIHEKTVDAIDEEKIASGSSVVENESLSEPSEKIALKKEKICKELTKKFGKIFRTPGEPVIKFSLVEGVDITKNITEINEIQRRNKVELVKIFLKIRCNGIEVCKTKIFTLNDNFVIDINECISILLIDIPKYLTVEIFEIEKSNKKRKLCSLNLPITNNDSPKEKLEHKFEKKDTARSGSALFDLKSAADNVGIKISNKESFNLKINGFLTYQMEWDRKQNSSQRKSLQSDTNMYNDIVDKNYIIDYDKLKAISETNKELFGGHEELLNELFLEENQQYFR